MKNLLDDYNSIIKLNTSLMILHGHWFIPLKNLQNIRSGFFRNS